MAQRNILIAVDRSEHSAYAFQWTLDNIVREGDHLFILYALETNQWASLGTASSGRLRDLFRAFNSACPRDVGESSAGARRGPASYPC